MDDLKDKERAYLDAFYDLYEVRTLEDKRDLLRYMTSQRGKEYCSSDKIDQEKFGELERKFIQFTLKRVEIYRGSRDVVRQLKKMPC